MIVESNSPRIVRLRIHFFFFTLKRGSEIKYQNISYLLVFVDRLAKLSKILLYNHLVHRHFVFKVVVPCNQLREKVTQLKIKPAKPNFFSKSCY